MMKGKEWTRYEIKVLTAGYCNLYSLSDIAETLNRTVVAIRDKAQVLGLKRPRARYATYN